MFTRVIRDVAPLEVPCFPLVSEALMLKNEELRRQVYHLDMVRNLVVGFTRVVKHQLVPLYDPNFVWTCYGKLLGFRKLLEDAHNLAQSCSLILAFYGYPAPGLELFAQRLRDEIASITMWVDFFAIGPRKPNHDFYPNAATLPVGTIPMSFHMLPTLVAVPCPPVVQAPPPEPQPQVAGDALMLRRDIRAPQRYGYC